MPESPRYFVKQGRAFEGAAVLCRLGGVTLDSVPVRDEHDHQHQGDDNKMKQRDTSSIPVIVEEAGEERVLIFGSEGVKHEFQDMEREVWEAEVHGNIAWKDLFRGTSLTALIVGAAVSGVQQITGVNWFMNYGPNIVDQLGMSGFLGAYGTNTVNMVATLATFFLVDRIGRKQLLVWGTNIILLVFFLMTIIFYSIPNVDSDPTVGITILLVIYVFQAAFAITWGPMGWLIPAEVMPVHVRGKGAGIATASNMFLNFVFGDKVPIITQQPQVWGMSGTCLFFLLCNICITLPYCYFVLPETANVSMEEMRGVLNYACGGGKRLEAQRAEKHGVSVREEGRSLDDNAGTWVQFMHRNWQQTMSCLTCRKVDTRLGLIPPLSAESLVEEEGGEKTTKADVGGIPIFQGPSSSDHRPSDGYGVTKQGPLL